MPQESAKMEEGTPEEIADAQALSPNTTKVEIPYSPEDIISLKITIEFELKPRGGDQATTRATEGGAHRPKEADRTYSRATEGGAHRPKEADRTYFRATEGGAHRPKEADRTYTPPRS